MVDLSPEGEIELTSGVFEYSDGGNWKQQVESIVDGDHPAVTHRGIFQVFGRRMDKGVGAIPEQLGHDGPVPGRTPEAVE